MPPRRTRTGLVSVRWGRDAPLPITQGHPLQPIVTQYRPSPTPGAHAWRFMRLVLIRMYAIVCKLGSVPIWESGGEIAGIPVLGKILSSPPKWVFSSYVVDSGGKIKALI
jgi:hypothetical protein